MNLQTQKRFSLSVFVLIVATVFILSGEARAQQTKSGSRDIVPVFTEARVEATTKTKVKKGTKTPGKKRKAKHKRISKQTNSGVVAKKSDKKSDKKAETDEPADIPEDRSRQIGITLWQLNEVKYDARLETFVENDNGRKRYLLPERVSIDTMFQANARVRFTVENSSRGYLYIVAQEMYGDGTFGNASLIFPDKRINGGLNRIMPGQPVELPRLDGSFYFRMRPSDRNGNRLLAEVMTIIITDRPIPGIRVSDRAAPVSKRTLDGWKTKWAGRAEIFESDDEDTAYTRSEREAATGTATLTDEDPLPKTVFMVESNRNSGTLITVPLWYGER